jgi:hypothetical protein
MALNETDLPVRNLVAYGLGDVIERHRCERDDTGKIVREIPWALGAAIGHVESEHGPFAFNYYHRDAQGKQHLERAEWDGRDETLPDGTNGKPNAWAAGWLQIIRPYPRGLTLRARFDAEAEAKVLFPEWRTFYARAQAAGLTGRDLYAATYFGHNQGAGRLTRGLFFAHKGLVSVVNNSGLTDAPTAQRALVVALRVASLVPEWAALEERIKSGALAAECGP